MAQKLWGRTRPEVEAQHERVKAAPGRIKSATRAPWRGPPRPWAAAAPARAAPARAWLAPPARPPGTAACK